MNSPKNTWPRSEIVRYAASKMVYCELIDRLKYRYYETEPEIATEYAQEIDGYLELANEHFFNEKFKSSWGADRQSILFWECASEVINEIMNFYIYQKYEEM